MRRGVLLSSRAVSHPARSHLAQRGCLRHSEERYGEKMIPLLIPLLILLLILLLIMLLILLLILTHDTFNMLL